MSFFHKLSIQNKILLIPLFGTLGFGLYLLISVKASRETMQALVDVRNVQYPVLSLAKNNSNRLEKIKDLFAYTASTADETFLKEARAVATELRADLDQIKNISPSDGEEVEAQRITFQQYFTYAEKLSVDMANNKIDFSKIGSAVDDMNNRLQAIENMVGEFALFKQTQLDAGLTRVKEEAAETIKIGIALGLATIFVLFLVAIPITLAIKSNLKAVVRSLKDISQDNGDLTLRLHTPYKDEVGDLVFWFNNFIQKLNGIVNELIEATRPVLNLSSEVNTMLHEKLEILGLQREAALAARSAVDEISQRVNHIASSAAEAEASTQLASKASNEGNEQVKLGIKNIQELAEVISSTLNDVSELQGQTDKVNVVVEVIKSIAEQTNLLALNAAIESARAGEQGRGFAVVADEVRNLAFRTQESTQEINTIVNQLNDGAQTMVNSMASSHKQVENSVQLAEQTGERLAFIAGTVGTIAEMNQDISRSLQEQKQSADVLVNNVDEIQNKTEATIDASARLNSVSTQLSILVSSMESITQRFKV